MLRIMKGFVRENPDRRARMHYISGRDAA